MKITDSHAHLHFIKNTDDRDQVIKDAIRDGVVQIANVSVEMADWQESIKLSHQYPNLIKAIIGIHPLYVDSYAEYAQQDILQKILAFVDKDSKAVIGIGECGLDYKYSIKNKDLQTKIFETQIIAAQELNLPISMHIRNNKDNNDALNDAVLIIKKYKDRNPNLKFLFHCYVGTEEIDEFVNATDNIYVSFSGLITYGIQEIERSAKHIKPDKVLVETDMPYLSPVPYKGKINKVSYVIETLKKLAAIKGENIEGMCKVVHDNYCRFFSL